MTQKLARISRRTRRSRGVDDLACAEVNCAARMRGSARLPAIDRVIDAVMTENAQKPSDIGEIRDIFKGQSLFCEKMRSSAAGPRSWHQEILMTPFSFWPPTIRIRSNKSPIKNSALVVLWRHSSCHGTALCGCALCGAPWMASF